MPMARASPDAGLTFLLGGARSGKSAHAEALIAQLPPPWIYIATAEAVDPEMAERIAAHRARRDGRWQTIEAPLELAGALSSVPEGVPVLVDCLTIWLSNHLLNEADAKAECDKLLETLRAPRGPWFAVANETGLGIVPDNPLARRFRDAAGRLNQDVAVLADSVLLMVAGLAMELK